MKKLLFYGFLLCLLGGIAGLCVVGIELNTINNELPEFSGIKDYHPPVITQVFDRNGEVFATFSKERRTVISRAQMPDRLIKAFMGAEDAGFYEHSGIAVNGVVAAALAEARRRAHLMFPFIPNGRKRGGSTITQQLVKTFLLTPEKTYRRKIKEMLLAVQIEKALTKDEILFLYLNQIYFGNGAYGVEEAAKTYFGKHVGSLTLAECATLASMPKAPNEINPIANPERTLERRAYVLNQMEQHGFAKHDDVAAALLEPLPRSRGVSEFMGKAPYAAEEVRRYLVGKYGEDMMYRDGLFVRTTFDANACAAAQEAVASGVADVDKRAKWTGPMPRTQGALVAIDTETRQIIAMVGGARFEQGINRATQSKRQPGSSFKPFIYAEAIGSKQYTAATIMNDVPRLYEDALVDENGEKKDYTPENHGGKYRGDVRIRLALTDSINTVSFALLEALTPKRIVTSVKTLGLGSDWKERDVNLSLALGTGLVTPLELTNAYVTFADEGRYAKPVMILQVAKLNGTVLEQATVAKTQVMDRGVAYVMLSMMKSVVETGTAQRIKELHRPVAGKTGTTNFSKDAWFVGCVPGLCTGVWVGQDDAKPMGKDEFGGRAAAPIFLDFNRAVLAGKPVQDFIQPEGVTMQRINPATGQLSDLTDEAEEMEEVFLEGTGPNAAQ